MLEDNDDIRPHDWLEADEMVDEVLDGRTGNGHFKSRLHRNIKRSIKWMIDENMPFDDDGFREMLKSAFFLTINNGERDPHCSIVSNILSEDVNDHPIDRFHELLSCLRMHDIDDAIMMMPVWYAHELMKRNNITEYDDHETGVLLWKSAHIIYMRPCDDEIILKTKLIDVIMQSCGDDIDLRDGMMRMAFPDPSRGEDVPIMLAAVRSYFTSEPDYQAALSIFDDTTRSRFFRRYKKGYRKINRMMAFRRILKSCGGNANAMSGFMHTVIEINKVAHYNRRFADSLAVLESYWAPLFQDDFICPNPDIIRMMLANLAEGYPVEYITELIISENDWRYTHAGACIMETGAL